MRGAAERGAPARLLILSDTLAGGLGAAVRLQAEWFCCRHWTVTVAAPADGPRPTALATFVELSGVSSARQIKEMTRGQRAVRGLRQFVVPGTVVHVHGLRSLLLARLGGLPTPFVTIHGAHPDVTDPPGYAALRRGWLRNVPRMCARAVTVEPGYPPPWHYEPHASPNLRSLDVLPMPSGGVPTIGWIGGLDSRKQPELFVRAIAAVADRGHSIRGLLAGAGPRGEEIAALVRDTSAPVEMIGHADPVAVLRRSWALGLFARSEGTPLAVMEAMWAGRTVVGSPVAGIELLVGDTGTFAATVDAAADAFVRIAQDLDGTTTRGLAAAQRVRGLVGPWTPWDTTEPHYLRYLAGASG
ncbi:MAG TPA: glycosyltransferase family 4 protein [Acidimicrobiales bacterium]|nr:glycosyltransferase family 4 protein [Acidimicrobiales bacterium]